MTMHIARSCGLFASAALFATAGAAIEPVNVSGGVFFNELCPQVHAIYTVPAGKLLIIEDASARAVNAATASTNTPGIVNNVAVSLTLRTNGPAAPFGSADSIIVAGIGLPRLGGRAMRTYAGPDSQVLFLIEGCTVKLNTNVYFSGQLVDFP